ncbi:uncharacterized protein LOC118433665 [Folsomia candida]|uniref:uncharacterized protein LOC118433665 n=1 Tax=Folsomia candida TaxID=158441 RepID=UPI001604F49D|nr:uncharacterized protein LOC118433665 [Folsomia candida]
MSVWDPTVGELFHPSKIWWTDLVNPDSDRRPKNCPMVMYYSKKMPHLQSRFEQYTRGSFSGGIMEKWWEGWGVSNIAIGRNRARKEYEARVEQGVKINDIEDETDSPINSILISIIGNGIGVVLFLIEVRKRVVAGIKVLVRKAWRQMCVK